MKKIKKLSSRKYKIFGISSLILVGGIAFSLLSHTPQINMAGGVKCSEHKGKESCQSSTGCYWDGEISEGGRGCQDSINTTQQQIGWNFKPSPTPKGITTRSGLACMILKKINPQHQCKSCIIQGEEGYDIILPDNKVYFSKAVEVHNVINPKNTTQTCTQYVREWTVCNDGTAKSAIINEYLNCKP